MMASTGRLRQGFSLYPKSMKEPTLELENTTADPFEQFRQWFEAYALTKPVESSAMILSTASADGEPSARVVLLKEYNAQGFVFYTNYLSRKGEDLKANPRAALTFYWEPLRRQIRIVGTIEKVSKEESDKYFASRPTESQWGAWASEQDKVLKDREELTAAFTKYQELYPHEVPRPEHWGGYRLKPQRIEFWQARASRLHDRIEYQWKGGQWNKHRLSP